MYFSSKKHRILCIDNDSELLENISERLLTNGYRVSKVKVQDFTIENVKSFSPELVVLGVQQFEDIDVLKIIKNEGSTKEIPVFVYSIIVDEFFEVSIFKNGAEDFILKPLRMTAFISRIEAFFNRKNGNASSNLLKINGLEINTNNLGVRFPTGRHIFLPKKEFILLTYLAERAGQTFNRNELLNRIWGEDIFIGERTVDVHIRRLREKIGEGYIITQKGVGYMFKK